VFTFFIEQSSHTFSLALSIRVIFTLPSMFSVSTIKSINISFEEQSSNEIQPTTYILYPAP